MDSLLQVSSLTVDYRSAGMECPAVTDATFEINRGEAVGLLGESGCGKSTTALAVLRLLPLNALIRRGAVRFRGEDLLQLGERDMEKIRGADVSLVFQEPSIALNPVMRVGDQVAEVIRAHRPWERRRCRREAEELLRHVRLADARIYRSFPHELSGGEKQRVLIAQALSCRPALLIADEPTTGLDTCTQGEILDLFGELKRRFQIAFLFISHHPGVLARLADRIMVMYAGKIVEQGNLADVYQNPLHPYTRGLLHSIPEPPADSIAAKKHLRAIPGSPPDMGRLPAGCPFAPRCPVRMDICEMKEPPEFESDGNRRLRCFAHASAREIQ